ncbi:MAG: helix-turn-helix domain-containing protein [Gammaproteobacteria bacterium]|nr:helix-turn-helix domain-containing protein [Gammaproteobacteria bacterium]
MQNSLNPPVLILVVPKYRGDLWPSCCATIRIQAMQHNANRLGSVPAPQVGVEETIENNYLSRIIPINNYMRVKEPNMAQKIDYLVASPEAIEASLGRRFERLRLSKNINQSALAEEAGVSRRTITRLENGEGVSLDTFVRVMRALGVAERLDALLPDPVTRPVERIRLGGRERQRARTTKSPGTETWHWGPETDDQ